ncbi:hypothetical protein ILYODFUR_021348 [Ilyodon furcidens]|uniref:Uncharacterized protein n=1 Tax=Ilyodon furcidens TaxID=33524 RepID=A0ABV0VGG0_9TELE
MRYLSKGFIIPLSVFLPRRASLRASLRAPRSRADSPLHAPLRSLTPISTEELSDAQDQWQQQQQKKQKQQEEQQQRQKQQQSGHFQGESVAITEQHVPGVETGHPLLGLDGIAADHVWTWAGWTGVGVLLDSALVDLHPQRSGSRSLYSHKHYMSRGLRRLKR